MFQDEIPIELEATQVMPFQLTYCEYTQAQCNENNKPHVYVPSLISFWNPLLAKSFSMFDINRSLL